MGKWCKTPNPLAPNDPDAIHKIVAEIDKERDDLLEYREKVKRWKSFNKKLDINNLEYITADLLEFYDPVTRQFEPPKHCRVTGSISSPPP